MEKHVIDSIQTFEGRKKSKTQVLFSVLLIIYDFTAVCIAYFLALWMRFDFVFSQIEQTYLSAFGRFILL